MAGRLAAWKGEGATKGWRDEGKVAGKLEGEGGKGAFRLSEGAEGETRSDR